MSELGQSPTPPEDIAHLTQRMPLLRAVSPRAAAITALARRRAYATTTSSNNSSDSPSTPADNRGDGVTRALPGPRSAAAVQDGETPAPTTLRVGESLKLDAMGPLVVNVDGSVARVANWAEMTPAEREGTLRVLARRNRERLDALKKGE